MSNAAPSYQPFDEPPEADPVPAKAPLLADPVVRVMVFVSLGALILFLATVLGVVATGSLEESAPRSAAERQILLAQAEGTVGEASAPYINALVAAGNLTAARVALGQARASVAASAPVSDLDLAEARLASADKKYEDAIAFADKAMQGYQAEADALTAKSAESSSSEKQTFGPSRDYYNAALVKAYALVELRRFDEAVKAFDIYIDKTPTASDVLIDRGNAKIELKDNAGAEKDFRAALRFVPYDSEAKEGLKRIGVAQ